MFFKNVLFSLLIFSSLLSSSLQADPQDDSEVPDAKKIARKLKHSPDDALKIKLAVKFYSIWQEDLGGNFEQFIVFLKSPSFKLRLWKKKELRLAVSEIGTSHSAVYDASSDVMVSNPERPLWRELQELFGDNVLNFQMTLRESVNEVVDQSVCPPYNDLSPEKKYRLLQRATRMKDRCPTPEKLARNLNSLYQGEFNGSMKKLCDFIRSDEFISFLRRHPERRKAFNRIAIERSVFTRACADLLHIEDIPETSLFSYLTDNFKDNLIELQIALENSVERASYY